MKIKLDKANHLEFKKKRNHIAKCDFVVNKCERS